MSDTDKLAGMFQRITDTANAHLKFSKELCNQHRPARWRVNDENDEDYAALSLQIDLGNDHDVDLTLWKNGDPPTVTLWRGSAEGDFTDKSHRSFREWLEVAAGVRPRYGICSCCGFAGPELFSVPDSVWQYYIPQVHRRELICFGCWREITRLTDGAAFASEHAGDDDELLAEAHHMLVDRDRGVRWIFGPPDPDRLGPKDAES